jgi:hypothetical protein
LIYELGNHFPSHEFMDTFEVVYPQYWLGLDLETSFQLHLNVFKDVYYVPKNVGCCLYVQDHHLLRWVGLDCLGFDSLT